MSQDRNIKWLNDRRIVYRRDPETDIPTVETDKYKYYEDGTYQCYHLFNSKAKITTYKSLKWHMLVLYYLNIDNDIEDQIYTVFRFIADKENGFVTFFIKTKILNDMGKKITWGKVAGLLDCSTRTIYRNLNKQLKKEKQILNEEL